MGDIVEPMIKMGITNNNSANSNVFIADFLLIIGR